MFFIVFFGFTGSFYLAFGPPQPQHSDRSPCHAVARTLQRVSACLGLLAHTVDPHQ